MVEGQRIGGKPILLTMDPIPRGPTVNSRLLGQEFDSGRGGRFFGLTRLCRGASAESDPDHSPSSKMYGQRLTQKHLVAAYRVASGARQLRRFATVPPPETPQLAPSSKQYRYEKAEPEQSRVVQKIRANPIAFKIVRAIARAMGYGSTKQVAGRRTLAMYEQVCAIKASEDRVFWQGEYLPLVCGLFPRRLTPGHLSL